MKLAVIGAGISGLTAAWLLAGEHDVTVFEAEDYAGGHTHTLDVDAGGRTWAIDTGFIVFNELNYPNFVRLLDRLGVLSKPSTMCFSVHCELTGLEYRPSNLDTLFAQRRNLLRPWFWRMIRDIFRFRRESLELLEGDDDALTLGEYLDRRRYSRAFAEKFLVPMGSAIWSAGPGSFGRFPARLFAEFFDNHGFLKVKGQPEWRVIRGGSRTYVRAMLRSLAGRVRLSCPVQSVRRVAEGVEVRAGHACPRRFDQAIIAAHSDQALAMLADPTPAERDVLGAIGYQPNDACLHTDTSLLPRRRKAWASWNAHIPAEPSERVAVTYDMNILQGLDAPEEFCVTLNRTGSIAPETVRARMTYAHPVYTPAARAAQKRWNEISGIDRIHYAGAYWGYGFHEDGVNSALAVTRAFGKEL
jgi:predicted NAD/FAD-binding protein